MERNFAWIFKEYCDTNNEMSRLALNDILKDADIEKGFCEDKTVYYCCIDQTKFVSPEILEKSFSTKEASDAFMEGLDEFEQVEGFVYYSYNKEEIKQKISEWFSEV